MTQVETKIWRKNGFLDLKKNITIETQKKDVNNPSRAPKKV